MGVIRNALQPPIWTRLDWSHPLTRGLNSAVTAAFPDQDFAQNGAATTNRNSLTYAPGRRGRALHFTGSNTPGLDVPGLPFGTAKNSRLALIAPAGDGTYRTISNSNVNGGGGLQWRLTATNGVGLLQQGVAGIGTGTATSITAANGPRAVGFSYDGSNYAFYLDGASDGSGAATQAFNNSVAGSIGLRDASAEGFNGDIFVHLSWNRILTADEFRAISDDPYQIWLKPRRPLITSTGPQTYGVSISEAGAASDAVSNTATLPSAISEAGAASDAPSSNATLPSSLSEAGAAADALSSAATLPSSISEAGAATDQVSQGGTVYAASISEAAAATDALTSAAVLPSSFAEAASAADAMTNVAVLPSVFTEAAAAGDSMTGGGALWTPVAANTTTWTGVAGSSTLWTNL